MTDKISITEMLISSFYNVEQENEQEEKKKLGNLRVGNSGIVDLQGNIYASCPRKAYLRLKGISSGDAIAENRRIMFMGGKKSEEIWQYLIEKQWKDTPEMRRTILAEEDIPVEWELGRYKITGRPDLVLCNVPESVKTPIPVLGLELKMASSLWTARDVRLKAAPKLPHLVQAAHYSWKLGVPFKLCYISYVDFAVNGWIQRHFPKQGEPGSEVCGYNDKGDPIKMFPFFCVYDLKFDDTTGILYFRAEGAPESAWTQTIVTRMGIEDYYKKIIRMDTENQLPVKPKTVDYSGAKANYSMCSYCPLDKVCKDYKGDSASEWADAVRHHLTRAAES